MFLRVVAYFFYRLSNAKAIGSFLIAALFLPATCFAGEVVLSGVYQGKNLFVQNPFAPDKQNYCADEVYVNNVKRMANIRQSAFEIDLSHLEIDDAVTIRIIHKDGCAPKVINPQVLRPSTTFIFNSIKVDENSIDWTSTGETPKYMYNVEQFVNGNWLSIKKFEAKGNGF